MPGPRGASFVLPLEQQRGRESCSQSCCHPHRTASCLPAPQKMPDQNLPPLAEPEGPELWVMRPKEAVSCPRSEGQGQGAASQITGEVFITLCKFAHAGVLTGKYELVHSMFTFKVLHF